MDELKQFVLDEMNKTIDEEIKFLWFEILIELEPEEEIEIL